MRESEKGPTQKSDGTRGNQSTNNRYQRTQRNNYNKPQLKGAIEELKSNVYFLGGFKQNDNYNTVTRNIYMYMQRTMDYGDNIVTAVRQKANINFNQMISNLPIVKEVATNNQKLAGQQWVQKIIDREGIYEINKTKAFGIIYGQCTRSLQNKLEEQKDYLTKIYNNPIETMAAIKELCYGYQPEKYPMWSVISALRTLCNIKKCDDESLNDYQRGFLSAWDIFYSLEGHLFFESYIKNVKSTDIWDITLDIDYRENMIKNTSERVLAYIFMMSCDVVKTKKLVEDLNNDYTKQGKDKDKIFLKNLSEAVNTISNIW